MEMDRKERLRRLRITKLKQMNSTVAIWFAASIILLSVAGIIAPDVSFSKEENRILTQRPDLTWDGITSKKFMENIESYTSDQFVGRDFWVNVKVHSDMLLGKREFNGVYLGKKKYLMQKQSEPDEKNVAKNLKAINKYAKKNSDVNVNVMLVPNAAYILEDYMPAGAPVKDQGQQLKQIKGQLSDDINCIDISASLKEHASEGIYYKTDHHWTTKGAYLGFQAAAEDLGISDPITSYDIYQVTNTFSGTLASTSGYHGVEDTIEVYAPKKSKVQYLVTDSDNNEKSTSVYRREALKEKDQYQVFFGGNHGMVEIKTTAENNSKLLVVKDSYANCFVPFLIPYYSEIIMIDPRYYYENTQNLTENKGITDVLFLYNMDTFLTDRSIADALTE